MAKPPGVTATPAVASGSPGTLSQGRFGPARGLSRVLALLAGPAAVERTWLAEFESARQDHRAVTYTMHPEAIGRGYLARMLDSVVTAMAERGGTWFATHAQIAELAGPRPPKLCPCDGQL